jgi:hypothetical protein
VCGNHRNLVRAAMQQLFTKGPMLTTAAAAALLQQG